jgi:prepilin-type N-terminal cleavage/methylation domain-containing protein
MRRRGIRGRVDVRRRGERGFTLIELMVTMIVSVIGLAALLQLYVSMSRANDLSARQLEATTFAEESLEAVRGYSQTDLTNRYGAFPIDEELPQHEGRNDVVFLSRLKASLVGADMMQLVRVRVEVTWTDPGAVAGSDDGAHDHRIQLEVLRSMDEAQ